MTTTPDLVGFDTSGITGHKDVDRYVTVKTRQGSRVLYTLQLALHDVPRVLPVPDPNRTTPGNRKVSPEHAHKFGVYLRTRTEWVAPPLLVRDSGSVQFEEQVTLPDGSVLGQLLVPRNSRAVFKIIDGQHRVLGIDDAVNELDTQIADVQDDLARREADAAEKLRAELDELLTLRQRFVDEHIAVQIYVEGRPQAYEQMFFDVADNALGINQAVKVRFDSRKVVNRALPEVLKHALLKNRVDMEQDRIVGSNRNLLGAKHVADIIRAVNVGVTGRVTERREGQLDESTLIENTETFLGALLNGFGSLGELTDGRLTPPQLRSRSLLGSITMLRVLAGAFHDLYVLRDVSEDEVVDYFATLNPHMGAPVFKNSVWWTTGDFTEGTNGPNARTQNLKHLTDEIVRWHSDGLPTIETTT